MPTIGLEKTDMNQQNLSWSWDAIIEWLDQLSTSCVCYINMMVKYNMYLLTTLQQLVQDMRKQLAPCEPSTNSLLPQTIPAQSRNSASQTGKATNPVAPQHQMWNVFYDKLPETHPNQAWSSSNHHGLSPAPLISRNLIKYIP